MHPALRKFCMKKMRRRHEGIFNGTQKEKPTGKTAIVCEYIGDMIPSCVFFETKCAAGKTYRIKCAADQIFGLSPNGYSVL